MKENLSFSSGSNKMSGFKPTMRSGSVSGTMNRLNRSKKS